jgi:branched-chain amino acid transport system substrate-binding protein
MNECSVTYIALPVSTQPGRPAEETPIYRGAQIAIEELSNDKSLPIGLGWKVFDDFGNLEKRQKFAKEIVADPTIIGVVIGMGSNGAFDITPIFNEAGLVQISPCASHPDLCQRGHKTFFRLVANEEIQGRELARMAYSYLNSRAVAVVYANDAWGAVISEIFAREYVKLGGKVIERQNYPNMGNDFTGLIRATVTAKPDLVFLAVHPREGVIISAGLRQAGLKVPFLGTDAMKVTFPLGGGEEDAKVYQTYAGADFRRLPGAATFRSAYVARYPEDSTYSPEAYDSVMIIGEALRRVGNNNRKRILEEVAQLRDFQGVSGLINFDAMGEREDAPISFYQVRKADQGRSMEYLGTTLELLS